MKNGKISPGKGITNDKFPIKLKSIMKKKEINVYMLAKKSDEPLPYLLEVIKGHRSIQLKTLIKFSKVLNVPLLDFNDCILPESKEHEEK